MNQMRKPMVRRMIKAAPTAMPAIAPAGRPWWVEYVDGAVLEVGEMLLVLVPAESVLVMFKGTVAFAFGKARSEGSI